MTGAELNTQLSNMNTLDVIKGIVKRFRFVDYARVTSVTDGFVDAEREGIKFTNMEVLSLGAQKYAINIVPAKDDIVLILSSRTFIKDIKDFKQDTNVDSYSSATLKCIPICSPSKATSKITIDQNGFDFTDGNNNSIKLTGTGVDIADGNNNTISLSSSGVSINNKLTVSNT